MATGGGKPGITTPVIVLFASGSVLQLGLKHQPDVEYFKVGDEYVAFFMPAPPEHSGGSGGEQGDG